MAKYRKKPVVIEAVLWDGTNYEEICAFMKDDCPFGTPAQELIIHTLEGDYRESVGDFIIKGIAGEYYPCKPAIFAATYELVKE